MTGLIRCPATAREDADLILLAAAAGGAELADLGALAAQMRQRLCPDAGEGKPGFEDRQVRLRTTLGGAGRLDGDLTEGCAQAIQAVLDALGKKAGRKTPARSGSVTTTRWPRPAGG